MNQLTELGTIFTTGSTVPENGNYMLVNDDTKPDWTLTNLGRVLPFKAGDSFPPHPDTDESTEWQFIRVQSTIGRYHPEKFNQIF